MFTCFSKNEGTPIGESKEFLFSVELMASSIVFSLKNSFFDSALHDLSSNCSEVKSSDCKFEADL